MCQNSRKFVFPAARRLLIMFNSSLVWNCKSVPLIWELLVVGIVMIESTKTRTWAVVNPGKIQGQEKRVELKYYTQISSPVNSSRPAGAHIEGRTNFSTIK